MKYPMVVGLLGRGGSGKSTAAKHLETKYKAKIFSFAKPLKNLAKILFAFSDEQVFGTQAQKEAIDERWGMSPRTAMIRLGDGARNVCYDRIWVDICLGQILQTHDAWMSALTLPVTDVVWPIYVIDDVRYPNEAAIIRSDERIQGAIIKLVCPDSDSSEAYRSAPSELSVDEVPQHNIDCLITSHKTPGSVDLKDKIDNALRSLNFTAL